MLSASLRRAGARWAKFCKPSGNQLHTGSSTEKEIIKCKAAVAWAPGEPLVVEQVEVDPPKHDEVRIKITHSSLCYTDLTFWKDKDMKDLFPRIFGHEAAGIVESVGEGVSDFQPGDHVIPILQGECKQCKYCTSGKTNLCGTLRADTACKGVYGDKSSRFRAAATGASISHFLGNSTFSQFTVIHRACLAKVDKRAPLDKICLLGCGITTGLGAVWNAAKVEKGASVAVFGLGTVGLAVVQAAKASGASKIIGVDFNPSKLQFGKTFGITDFVNPKEHERPVQEVIVELTGGGVDYSFECIGNTDLMKAAMESTHDGWGLTTVVGVPKGGSVLSISPFSLLFGYSLKGTVVGGYKPSELPALVDKYLRKEIKVDEYVTHQLPLEKINDAFDLLKQGDCLRCVLTME